MALLNRFSRLNDRGETGVFTFIVTKSVTRDIHRDATTKDFCFGYHRWAVSFQRPNERVLGVHLLLRNPSPSTSCVVDFTLTLLNRQHFSLNEVYTKCQAKFTITNPMQGVPRWIQISDLVERHFSNETGEFLFELALSNMTTIFECDIQLSPSLLGQYKSLLRGGSSSPETSMATTKLSGRSSSNRSSLAGTVPTTSNDLINLETNYFTFGAFDWSLTVVPLVMSSAGTSSTAVADLKDSLSSQSLASAQNSAQASQLEPVCRVYLNRLNGHDCLCRVKYRVILGHHQATAAGQQPAGEHADSKLLDQISDADGRIRGHQFRHTNLLKLISLRSSCQGGSSQLATATAAANTTTTTAATTQQQPQASNSANSSGSSSSSSGAAPPTSASASASTSASTSASSLDLRVHIEMFCANTVSEAKVALQRKPNEAQVSNCCDRNKQAWCVESAGDEEENVRLKLFFVDLQSVPRNHIRYISWIAYLVRRDHKSGHTKESVPVRNSPHSNYYLQDGIDLGTIMDTDIPVKELNSGYLDQQQQLMVHIEWVDSLLLFSHLYNNYDALATIQRHQIGQELNGLQLEFDELERKYVQCRRSLSQLMAKETPRATPPPTQPSTAAVTTTATAAAVRSQAAPQQATQNLPRHGVWQEQAAQIHVQPQQKPPMSLDERLKFSSSTSPVAGRRRLPQQPPTNYQHRASLEQQSVPLLSLQQQQQELARRTSSANATTLTFGNPVGLAEATSLGAQQQQQQQQQQQHLLASQVEAFEQVQPQNYAQRSGSSLGQHHHQLRSQVKLPPQRPAYNEHYHRRFHHMEEMAVVQPLASLQLHHGLEVAAPPIDHSDMVADDDDDEDEIETSEANGIGGYAPLDELVGNEPPPQSHLRLLASHSYGRPSAFPPALPPQLKFVSHEPLLQEPPHLQQYLQQAEAAAATNLRQPKQYSNRL